jgi:arylsulfatase A-like enzyme
MPWRDLITVAAGAAITLTAFEIITVGNAEGFYVEHVGMLCRVLAVTAVPIAGLCMIAGVVGGLFNRRLGLTRTQAAVAGALAPVVPLVAYLGRVDVRWDYNQQWLWFAIGIPAGFVCISAMLRARPSRVEQTIGVIWPAFAPIACWTLLIQWTHQYPTFVRSSIWMLAGAWLAGVLVVALVIRSRPIFGHSFSVGLVSIVVVAALGSSVTLDLNRSDSLLTSTNPTSPPVILLTVDTLRRDALSLYGSTTATPAIDSLGRDGVVFDRAYSTAPWTYVSFASIHSGLTPWGHGVRTSTDRVPEGASALAQAMQDHGYNTGAIGDNALLTVAGPAAEITQAFNDYFFFPRTISPITQAQLYLASSDPSVLGTHATTQQLSEYGSAWVRNHAEDPFFLWLHFFDPHNPYDRVLEFPPDIDPPPGLGHLAGKALMGEIQNGTRRPGLKDWSRALYQSEVRAADQAVGEFLETLKELGLYDRALIVLTSDHGEEFAEHNKYWHGQSLYNELVRVPLIVKLPSETRSERLSQPVSTVAIAPTILDLARVPFDEDLFSAQSLRQVWNCSETTGPPAAVFMTGINVGDPNAGEPAEAVVWDNYKYIRWERIDHEELYDIDSDPDDQHNLALRLPEQVAIGRALLADHATKEAKLAEARGFKTVPQEPLTPDEERILRGLGYLQ